MRHLSDLAARLWEHALRPMPIGHALACQLMLVLLLCTGQADWAAGIAALAMLQVLMLTQIRFGQVYLHWPFVARQERTAPAMNPINREIDRGVRVVDGVTVSITELVWADDGRSFQVQRVDTGDDLTIDGCLDHLPTDSQIRGLLDEACGLWRCPGCHTALDVDLTDLIDDHLRDCLPGHRDQIPDGDRSGS